MKRAATMHTLHHSSVRIAVVDVRCPSCEKLLRYDGDWDGLFSYSVEHLFTPELIGRWTYDVCAKVSTFRDPFDTWFERCNSVTARIHKLDHQPLVGRRQANGALSALLKTLTSQHREIWQHYSLALIVEAYLHLEIEL